VNNSFEIAQKFNAFFTSIATTFSDEINPSDIDIDVTPTTNCKFDMSSFPVTSEELELALGSLQDKKTPDLNNVSMHLLKKVIIPLKSPLIHIFSRSLHTGIVPDRMKIAKVVPIFKSGSHTDINNYRPISLLCSFSKILEKIVAGRLLSYLNSNNLISPNQFGFRAKHSTVHPMFKLLNSAANAINNKKFFLVIFCDLRKAFDTCDINILLKKLTKLGIQGAELAWFKNYLCNRKQYVAIDDAVSDLLSIIIGVPQGSILGPLLFLLYINDLPSCSTLLSLLFADDTALAAEDDNIVDLVSKVNVEFQKVCKYFRTHKLSLHPDKTKFMLISNAKVSPTVSIFINNNNDDQFDQKNIFQLSQVFPTDQVPAIKYLGVYFDPQLNFKFHIDYVSKKISQALFTLRSAKNFLPKQALKSLYFSLVHCHLVYAVEIWGSTLPSYLNVIFLKQKAALRIVSGEKYNAHTEHLFKKLGILKFNDICLLSKLKIMFQILNRQSPQLLHETWPTNRQRRTQDNDDQEPRQNLRNDDDIFEPLARYESTLRLPLFSLPKIWNDLPTNLKNLRSTNSFVNNLKNTYLNTYSNVPVCTRLFCPVCLRT
jgi:hypothetical protein